MGAYDFLTKPADPQHLCLLVQRALRERALQDEVVALRQQLGDRHTFQNVLSRSPKMYDVFELIGHIADTTSTVLIRGETGTGKEQVARAIHQASRHAAERPVRRGQLRRAEREPAGKRAVRAREGVVHRGRQEADRPVRVGQPGDAVPRRDRRRADVDADQAAARAPGAAVRAGRRRRADRGGRAGDRRDPPGPGKAGERREVPRGPVLPAERDPDRPAAAARPARRTSRCWSATSARSSRGPARSRRR